MCVYILSHADVKYLFFQFGYAALVRCFFTLLSRTKAWITNGKWEFTTGYEVPAAAELGMHGQKMLNLQWEMGDGKREITDPAARSLAQRPDSAGWSVEDGRSQRDMGKWQTGRGLMAHGSWPMSTGTVLKLSPRGPFAR